MELHFSPGRKRGLFYLVIVFTRRFLRTVAKWHTTGLKLNLEKCLVALIRCAGTNLDDILENFAGRRVTFPLIYLGLPLTLGRLKVAHVQSFVDKSRAKLAGWQGRLLNQAGRRELTRSVLSAMPIYLLTSLRPPKQMLQDIDKIRRRFLWAGDMELTGGSARWHGRQ